MTHIKHIPRRNYYFRIHTRRFFHHSGSWLTVTFPCIWAGVAGPIYRLIYKCYLPPKIVPIYRWNQSQIEGILATALNSERIFIPIRPWRSTHFLIGNSLVPSVNLFSFNFYINITFGTLVSSTIWPSLISNDNLGNVYNLRVLMQFQGPGESRRVITIGKFYAKSHTLL